VVRFLVLARTETKVHVDDDPAATEPEARPAAGGAPSRRRAPGADPEVRSFGAARVCAADGCQTKLSRYNPDSYCSVHRGWDRQVITRRRRTDDDEPAAELDDEA
jgi:hypothetical protein